MPRNRLRSLAFHLEEPRGDGPGTSHSSWSQIAKFRCSRIASNRRPAKTLPMQAVLEYLKRNESRFIDELCEYVRFPSVSAQPQHRQDLHACAEWLVRHCQQIGLEARLCPTEGHPIVVAKTPRLGAPASLSASRKGSRLAGGDAGAPRRAHFVVYGHYDV